MPPIMMPVSEQAQEHINLMAEAIDMVNETIFSEGITLATEALNATEIPVGCVFVRNGKVIARGRNRTNETRNASLHAELDALSQILPGANFSQPGQPFSGLEDVTLYVTVEPCLMCASALRQVGIRKCYYGCANDRFGGCGGVLEIGNDPALVYSDPLEAIGGYMREEAIMLLRRFYITENTNAPAPRDKTKRVLKTEIEPLPLQ